MFEQIRKEVKRPDHVKFQDLYEFVIKEDKKETITKSVFVCVVPEGSTKPHERLEKEKRGEGGTERTREEVNVKR